MALEFYVLNHGTLTNYKRFPIFFLLHGIFNRKWALKIPKGRGAPRELPALIN